MIRCPKCKRGSLVTHTRETLGGAKRRRACCSCDYRWTTYEVPVDLGSLIGDLSQSVRSLRLELRAAEQALVITRKAVRPYKRTTVDPIPDALKFNRNWTAGEIKTLRELYPVIGMAIAERLGRTSAAVRKKASDLGIEVDYARRASTDCNAV